MSERGAPEKARSVGLFGDAGGSAKGILLVLLALAVCLGYFYFFTDIFRPKEESSALRDVYTSEVKRPLPERPSTTAAAVPAEEKRPAAPAPPAAPVQPVAVAPVPKPGTQQKTVPPQGAKAVTPPTPPARAGRETSPPVTTKPGETGKTPVVAVKPAPPQKQKPVAATPEKPASKGSPATGAVVKKEPSGAASKQAKRPAEEKKSHEAERTSPTSAVPLAQGKSASSRNVTAAEKDKVVEKPGKNTAGEAVPVSKKQETFTLIAGTYVLKTTVLADKAKLEKAGLRPVINVGRKRNETMNRLVVAEFASYSSAHAELGRVKKVSKDAFVLHNNGRYVVYAGSYYRTERAIEEVERLKKHGVSPVVKKSAAPVSSYTLTVGDFPTREAARKGEDRLKKLGFKPSLSPSYRN